MADRYVLIEVNEDGEGRLKDEAVTWIDFRLSIVDFNASEGLNQLMEQISKDVKDELVLVLFNYRVKSSYDSWSGATEYEDFFDVEFFKVIKKNYKKFYQGLVTVELDVGINGFDNIESMPTDSNQNYYRNLIAEWEEFYNEDFIPLSLNKR
ncbi:hypothetical protein BHY07_10395 [Bacillus subtilis subsp. subtilis]|uniref:Uncharacterized protein YozJ n=6 Tax=Bacillus subtilis TaxID=1423 RepID=YOZJ_BACSU|nr:MULTISPECIES: hypothetical protein [Bacillales]NP_389771.1 hypothetical protein BSU_18900 [Bacillus subtilis subsp. subtilis str. 168]O31839.1 RecName: Full=Uncharacterized protein YozJ [Bacillus subtilis subsp. subtilis str. 168]BAM52550.1 hypothetical protein BEST7613_3619 [Bacillus subtilis BEST7613]AFQ57828.1 YozJ [Bacillus subtilis QB928]AGG61272.1 YozJ [Bacillus subtilis subsp. subtilis 6051-HGW]AHA77934.1 Uncharacterized protein yozJ [Bacillus subtilis PY79]AIC40320.1 hypothetical 